MSELPPQTPTSPENPASTPDGAEAEPKRVFKLDPTEYSKMREALDNAPEAGTTAPESKASDEEISTEISDKDSEPLDSETKELPKYKERKRSANTRINLGEVATSNYLDKYLKPDEKTGLPVLRKRRKRRLGTKLGKEIEKIRPAGAEVKSLLVGSRSLTTNRLSAEATAAVDRDYENRAKGKRYGKIERIRGHLGATTPKANVSPKHDMALREIHQSLKNRTAAGIRESGIGAIVEDDPGSIEQWAEEVTNPENVKQLKALMTANLKESGMDDDFTKVVIENAGVNGSLNLDLVASYFGVDVEDWSRQCYGNRGVVPTVVVDHVNFLLKQPDTLLSKFADHEPHVISNRVEEWRQAAKADTERLARLRKDREELTPVIETLDELYMQLEHIDPKSKKAKSIEAAIARENKNLNDRKVGRVNMTVGDPYNPNVHEYIDIEQTKDKKITVPIISNISGAAYASADGIIRRAKVTIKGDFGGDAPTTETPGAEPAGSPFVSPASMASVMDLANRFVAGQKSNHNIRRENEEQLIENVKKVFPEIDALTYQLKNTPVDQKKSKETRDAQAKLDNYLNAIKNAGIDRIPANPGELFDPKIHYAQDVEGEGDKETVAEEWRSGFKIGDRLIRPADVKVRKEFSKKSSPEIKDEPELSPLELATRYVAGEFRKDEPGVNFPTMSPESIATLINREKMKAETEGRPSLYTKINPSEIAQEIFEELQTRGIVSKVYEKTVGHRVLKPSEQILGSLREDEDSDKKSDK